MHLSAKGKTAVETSSATATHRRQTDTIGLHTMPQVPSHFNPGGVNIDVSPTWAIATTHLCAGPRPQQTSHAGIPAHAQPVTGLQFNQLTLNALHPQPEPLFPTNNSNLPHGRLMASMQEFTCMPQKGYATRKKVWTEQMSTVQYPAVG
jgi:hypothetical protein